jgi:3-oxoacyl-[acyl-carrier protein] reductase
MLDCARSESLSRIQCGGGFKAAPLRGGKISVKLQGQGILITGASQGLGKAIAQVCIQEGAHVFLSARNAGLLESAKVELSAYASAGQLVMAAVADISRAEEAERLVECAAKQLPSWDGLVNNAGIYGPIGPTEEVNWDDWTQAIAVNLMGTVLTCRAAVPIFRRKKRGKIVNLSGGGATAPLPRFSAYAASKAAVVRFTETLAEETRGDGIDVNAIAPGALNTRLLDQVLAAGSKLAGVAFYQQSIKQRDEGGAPVEKGARLCAFLLSTESDGITGKLISAVWDPWDHLPEHREQLNTSDIYTLRRIVPKDRGFGWGD